MKTWASFFTLLVAALALIALATQDTHASELWSLFGFLGATYGAGCCAWLLTRKAFWVNNLRGISGDAATATQYWPGLTRWYRNAMVCAFIFGGAVFWCSVDHNSMGESCVIVTPGNQTEVGAPNWSFNGEPCRLTPVAFLDLATGIGMGLAGLQLPLYFYWLWAHALYILKSRQRRPLSF